MTNAINVNGKRFKILTGSIEAGTMTLQGPRGGIAHMVKDLNADSWHLNQASSFRSDVVKSFELVILN